MIKNARSINLQHQRLWLLPQKAIYWQKKKTLLVADPHVGKAGHFRRNGIPVPRKVNTGNLEILDKIIKKIQPGHLIFLGDLFHSNLNEEWQQFKDWRRQHSSIEVTLVIGNHDILAKNQYHASHISIFKRLKMGPFLLIHDLNAAPESAKSSPFYPIGGHIHPALRLRGKGRQSMKFPCFYFGSEMGILPAFGQFTGTATIEPKPKDRIFIIVDDQIMPAKTASES